MKQSGDLSETIRSLNAPLTWRVKSSGSLTEQSSVLQAAMEKDIETWNGKGLGIKLSDENVQPEIR